MIIVEAREARERLTMEKTIGLMREALTLLEDGTAYQPPRTVLTIPHGNSFGFMPAYMGDNDYFGAKVITAFHGNLGTEYPSHMGYVMIFESVHGSPVGMADCRELIGLAGTLRWITGAAVTEARGIYRSCAAPAEAAGAAADFGPSRKMLKAARKLTGQARRKPAALHRR